MEAATTAVVILVVAVKCLASIYIQTNESTKFHSRTVYSVTHCTGTAMEKQV